MILIVRRNPRDIAHLTDYVGLQTAGDGAVDFAIGTVTQRIVHDVFGD